MNRPTKSWGHTNAGWIAASAAALLFGIQIPFVKLASDQGLHPTWLMTLRSVVVVMVFAIIIRTQKLPWLPSKEHQRGVGLFGLGMSWIGLCYLTALSFIPVSVATLCFYTFPLWITVISWVLGREPFRILALLAVTLALTGLLLAVGQNLHLTNTVGLGLALTASLGAAAQFFLAGRFASALSIPVIVFWVHLITIPPALITGIFIAYPLDIGLIEKSSISFWGATLTYILASGLQFVAFRHETPSKVGLIFCLEPITSIMIANMLLGDNLTLTQKTGIAFVISGIVLTLMQRKNPTDNKREIL